jgi:hypothetical protein
MLLDQDNVQHRLIRINPPSLFRWRPSPSKAHLAKSIRESRTSDQRNARLRLTIDPGFVHPRRLQTLVGEAGMALIEDAIGRLPELPGWQRRVRVDNIYRDCLLSFCRVNGVQMLGSLLAVAGHGRIAAFMNARARA